MPGINPRSVTVYRRLRPLRLAFLVRPTDKVALRRFFQINTCLWGGRFNPIVPVFRRTPRLWSDSLLPSPPAREIIKGYLAGFEPDYVVNMSTELIDGLGIPEHRLLTEKDVLDPMSSDSAVGYGLDVVELYADLYQKEFQFQRRHPLEVVSPQFKDNRMLLFGAACFGEFPFEESMQYLPRTYGEAFDAKTVEVDDSNLFTTLSSQVGFPLRMGSANIEVRRLKQLGGPILFYMNADSPFDLIDYWNLRATGAHILPVPRQWAAALVEKCSEFITQNYVPYRRVKGMMQCTTLLRARSVPVSEVKEYKRQLRTPAPNSLITMPSAPRMWEESPLESEILSEEGDAEVTITDATISFRSLSPSFAERVGQRGTPRWVNIIRIRDYFGDSESAGVIPPGLPDLALILGSFDWPGPWAIHEGIVLPCRYKDWSYRWTLPSGQAVFHAWAKGRGFELDLSGAGRVARQLIHALDGPGGSYSIAHEEIVKLLNDMASGQVVSEVEDASDHGTRSKVRSKIIPVGVWRTRLKQINDGDDERAKRHLEFLVQHSVLAVGLRLQCQICGQHNWYGVDSLGNIVTCERCLQQFNFPATEPPRNAWHYRTIGAFSVENYAEGGYCVALSLRLLGNLMNAQYTWIPSFTLKQAQGLDLGEVDFALFGRTAILHHDAPYLILGECRTYGKFQAKDVRKMRERAKAFPGAVLAFCTLRKTLNPAEKQHISALARLGRRPLQGDHWQHPVVVLTGTELFSDHRPPLCWRDMGGRFTEMAERYCGFGGITGLCDATQQLHLSMESHSKWFGGELMKMRARRAQQTHR